MEADGLIATGVPDLEESVVFLHGSKRPSTERTSKSAGLPSSSPIVQCVLSRAREFMGTLLEEDGDFGTPQLVRYEKGEKFDVHHDWYDSPQPLRDGSRQGRWWFNRVASFFVYLEEEDVVGGETWFPHLSERGRGGEKWRKHEDGGLAFKPIQGNALFWVNLFEGNKTGDGRVVHAGLPLEAGRKTAMNIWPRKFFRAR